MNEHRREYMRKWRADHPDYQKSWYAENQERLRIERAAHYLENRDAIRAKNKAYDLAHPDRLRKKERRSRGMLNPTGEIQHGPCNICGKEGKLNLDHDHSTGRRRGWLCQRCNLKLGHWEIILRGGLDVKFREYLKIYVDKRSEVMAQCEACHAKYLATPKTLDKPGEISVF